jgi:hypothetical protein
MSGLKDEAWEGRLVMREGDEGVCDEEVQPVEMRTWLEWSVL